MKYVTTDNRTTKVRLSLFSLHTGSTTTTNASLDRAEGTNGDLAADNCDVAAEEIQDMSQ